MSQRSRNAEDWARAGVSRERSLPLVSEACIELAG